MTPAALTHPFRMLGSTPGLDVGLIPAAFPLEGGAQHTASRLAARMLELLTARLGCGVEMFLQMMTLHLGGNALVSPNAGRWMPSYVMGVFPLRPPKLIDAEEFNELDPTAGFPMTFHPLLHVTQAAGREHCWQTMAGLGTLTTLVTPAPFSGLAKAAEQTLLPLVKEPLFQAAPAHAPLLDAKCAADGGAEAVARWLCGARAMVRESVEDKGILVVSLDGLEPILKQLQARPDAYEKGLYHLALD